MKNIIVFFIFLVLSAPLSAQSWKQAAEDSILKYRTTPVEVLVTDESGNPEEGITVRIKMLQHEFLWGTTVSITEIMKYINNGMPLGSGLPYYSHFSYFNSVTPANAGKWKGWLDIQQRDVYLKTIKWFERQGIANRGHTCVWESERFNAIPDFLKPMTDTSEIRKAVKSHITGQMNTLNDYLYEVDVVNELIHEQHITRGLLSLTDPAVEHAKWYKWAKQAAPNVNLIANEFDLFQSGNDFYKRYITYVNKMLAEGAPVDGVGMQGHFWTDMPSYTELKKRIEQVKPLGLPMEVTEFDMKGVAYDDMERVLYAVFSEPQIYNFTMWGAWDGAQWRNNGPLFYNNWELKPSGKAWMDLVHGKWWTDSTTVTGATGLHAINAFKGKHAVELRKGNKVYVDTFQVGDERVNLQLNTSLITAEIPEASISVKNKLDEYNVFQPAKIELSTNIPGEIERVDFMESLFVSYRDTLAPFVFETTSTGVGEREIYARVTCKSGYVFYTDSVQIKFVNKNAFPIITNLYPFNNQFFGVGSEIIISCEAEDYDGGIWKVEVEGLFNDSILVDTVAPFNFSVSGLEPGNYKVVVKALDSLHAYDRKIISFSVYDPGAQNVSVSTPLKTDQDVEEYADGTIVVEGDLDVGDKICGIYFQNPGIPKHAEIDSAFIQFTTDNTSLGEVTIPLFAELSASAKNFSTQTKDISERENTAAINWSPAEWEIPGESGAKQKSPDLTPILQELQNLDNWNESSPLVIITGFANNDNRRRVVSYDINSEHAPKLSVYYKGGFDLSPPEAPIDLRIVSQSESSISIDWDNPEPENILAYFVYVDGVRYQQNGIKSTQLKLENLSLGSVHEIYVTAINNLSVESMESNSVFSVVSGSKIRSENLGIEIYPNPFSSQLQIKVSSAFVIDWIEVLNLSGKTVARLSPQGENEIIWQGKGKGNTALPDGVYLLQIISDGKPHYKKVIKNSNN